MFRTPGRRRRRAASVIAALALAAAALTACVPSGSKATARVGTNGFSISIAGVTVAAPAGVAPEGTEVVLEAIEAPVPADVAEFASGVTSGISLTFEGGSLQPSQPLEVTFDVPSDVDGEHLFVIGEDDTTGTGVGFVDSVWNPEQSTVTATVEHLSWFQPVKVDEEKFSDQVADWIEQSAGVNSAKPACFGADAPLQFSAVLDDVVWPCVEVGDDGVAWSLQSNSGLVWEVLTEPQAQYLPLTALSVSGIVTIEAANLLGSALRGDTVVVPLETLRGTFEDSADAPFTIALRVEPGLSQVTTLLFGLSMMFPSKWVDLAMKAECFVNVVKAASSGPSGETWRTIMSCVGEFLKGVGGSLIGILMTGPGLFATQMNGLIREITQTNAVQFTLSDPSAPQVGDGDDGGEDDGADPILVNTQKPADAVWLHEMPQKYPTSIGRGGDVEAVVLLDGVTYEYANSTNHWAWCDSHSTTDFYLYGAESSFNFALGVQERYRSQNDIGRVVEFRALADGVEVGRWSVQRGVITDRINLRVDGVQILTMESNTPSWGADYKVVAALLDAWVQ